MPHSLQQHSKRLPKRGLSLNVLLRITKSLLPGLLHCYGCKIVVILLAGVLVSLYSVTQGTILPNSKQIEHNLLILHLRNDEVHLKNCY